jgi:hypothetical protein
MRALDFADGRAMETIAQTAVVPATSAANRLQWLVPSFLEVFFVFFMIWAFLAAPQGWQGLLKDADTGYHIRMGQLLLQNHGAPAHDPFSFAAPEVHWYAFEWLSQVCFAVLYGWAGLKAVVLFAGVVLASTFTILLRHAIWRGANALVSVALVLLAGSAATLHFHARPHIFTMLLLAITTWIIARDRVRHTPMLWSLPAVATLWANLHGGFAFFLVLLALLVVGCALEGRADDVRRYAGLLALCGAATLINPYGIGLPLHIYEIARSKWLLSLVDEFKAPDFRAESHLAYMLLLFLSLAVVIPLLRKNRVTEVLWILFLGCSSLISVRHITAFAIVSVPIIAVEWTSLLGEWKAARPLQDAFSSSADKFAHVGIWPVVFVCGIAVAGGITWPSDFDGKDFPVALAAAAPQPLLDQARIFTTDQWANYLIFKNPNRRVFLDSQHQLYGEKILSDALGMMSGRRDWRERLDHYGIEAVLCPRAAPLAGLLDRDAGWRKVIEDGQASLFARKL